MTATTRKGLPTRTLAWRLAMMAGAGAVGTAALAAGLSGADAAKDRQAHMKEMGKAAKAIVDQLRGGTPDMAVIKASAAKIDEDAKGLPTWFPAGSGPETGLKMAALPAVWTDKVKFDAKAHDLQVAAVKLDLAAGSGAPGEVMPAMKAVGDACKSCHETFKAKDQT